DIGAPADDRRCERSAQRLARDCLSADGNRRTRAGPHSLAYALRANDRARLHRAEPRTVRDAERWWPMNDEAARQSRPATTINSPDGDDTTREGHIPPTLVVAFELDRLHRALYSTVLSE